MVDLHMGEDAMFFVHPIYLLLLTPDYVPVVIPCLLPLAIYKTLVYGIFEGCFELDVAPEWPISYGGFG
jgi:hypothetical protein